MNANDQLDNPRVLPAPTMVIIVGLGMLWLAAFVYAAGLQFLALGLLASASVVAFTLLVAWGLGVAGAGPDLAELRAARQRRVVRQHGPDGRCRGAGDVVNGPYRTSRLHRSPDRPVVDWRAIDRPGTRSAGHNRRPGAHRRQPER